MTEENVVSEIDSLTPNALQRNWETPCRFPMCPEIMRDEPLSDYAENLTFGTTFTENEYGKSKTVYASMDEEYEVLSVIAHLNDFKDWSVVRITAEEGKFVHESISTYFTLEAAIKEHCTVLGKDWTDSIDDYC